MVSEVVVVKFGGSCIDRDCASVARAAVRIAGDVPAVFVHGYGARLREILRMLRIDRPAFVSASGVPSHFTTEEVAEASAVAAALVRGELTGHLRAAGARVGAFGAFVDDLVTPERKSRIRYKEGGTIRVFTDDRSGKVARVDADRVRALLDAHRCLLLSALLRDVHGHSIVVDADHLAVEIALALGARRLSLLTDQPGLLVERITVPVVRVDEIDRVIGHTSGGMTRKLKHIKRGLTGGLREILLADPFDTQHGETNTHGTRFVS